MKPATAMLGSDHISALAAANRFLYDWQNQDPEDGLVTLSNAAKEQLSEAPPQAFFAPGEEASYEISRGNKLKDGRYSFPLALFADIARQSRGHICHASQIAVIRTAKENWATDCLP